MPRRAPLLLAWGLYLFAATAWTVLILDARGVSAWGFLLTPAVWNLVAVSAAFRLHLAMALFVWIPVPILGVPLVTVDRAVPTSEALFMVAACASGLTSVVAGFIYERNAVRAEFGADLGKGMERMIAEGRVQRALRPIRHGFRKIFTPFGHWLRGRRKA